VSLKHFKFIRPEVDSEEPTVVLSCRLEQVTVSRVTKVTCLAAYPSRLGSGSSDGQIGRQVQGCGEGKNRGGSRYFSAGDEETLHADR